VTAPVSIEPITAADFATIASLADRIWHQHYASIVSIAQIDYMLAGRYTPESLAAYVGDARDRWMCVVRDGGESIGYLSYRLVEPDAMKLEQLYLLAERRGGGIGGRMLDHVEAHARALGRTRIELTVNKRNTGSIAVYERRGFVVREAATFDIGGGFVMDDYVMEKALA
jgi:ribosomal protein S18 acetylase RimI-like enzyme